VLSLTLRGSKTRALCAFLGGQPRKGTADHDGWDVSPKYCVAQAFQQYEMNAAFARFFVDAHQLLYA